MTASRQPLDAFRRSHFVAVGTMGLRTAGNSGRFLESVRARCGVDIKVIPGEEEGRLAYLAVQWGLGLAGGSMVVCEPGGGREIVKSSAYAAPLLGVPLPYLGVVFFAAVCALATVSHGRR